MNAIDKIARALLIDYTSVYYVNLNTDHYECYSVNQGYRNLQLQTSGEDFFADCRRDIQNVVYEEDREKLLSVLTKDAVLRNAGQSDYLSIIYRLVIDGMPVYHTMRLIHDDTEEDCIILGVLNIDRQVRAEKATESYNAIASTLANMYSTIYYVNLETEHYIEYSSSDAYKNLEVPPEGNDFFSESRKNIMRVVHPEDSQKVHDAFERETMIRNIGDGNPFYITYRLMYNGVADHVQLMAVMSRDQTHMVAAVRSIESEVQREQELQEVAQRNLVFSQIAESLASQYGMIYYVDSETDHYIEFTSQNEYKELNVSPVGENFFQTSQRNVGVIVHPSDRERVFHALDKQNILNELKTKKRYTITYQLMLKEGTSFTRLSVVWANDKKHLIMGVMRIDDEIKRENALKRAEQENQVYSQIAESLAAQYDTIYYVDMLSDSYMEFSSTDVYKSLEIQPSGENFFESTKENAERVIFEEDRPGFLNLLDKGNLLNELSGKHMITYTYRLLVGTGIMYARLSIIWAKDNKHLIMGVVNIDDEVKREQEVKEILHIANERAYRDELTGVKNKNAYVEYERQIQERIDSGTAGSFAVVVCDVNGLKVVNDQQGHKAGDAYIQSACELICGIWQHSPVFRIGGDEFVVILQGEDYRDRDRLLQELIRQSRINEKEDKVIVAAGMSVFRLGEDKTVADIFERADSRMYDVKIQMKGARV